MSVFTAHIDLKAFRHNLDIAREMAGKDVAVMPVIKADGYGHGVVPLARECLKTGAPMLAVGTVEEGVTLRKAKIAAPILILDGVFKEEQETVVKRKLTPVVYSLDTARQLNNLARKAGTKLPVHIKFDTGMSRLGFPFQSADEILPKLKKHRYLKYEGIMTHLASSPDHSSPQTELQVERFDRVIEKAEKLGFKFTWKHAANSGGVINFPSTHYNMVRPGIMLYGYPPCSTPGYAFKPVMTLTGRLAMVKDVPGGEGVGYHATYVTPRSKRMGVVMGGYAEGINRRLSNRGSVLWKGKALPITGLVCMDNFMVDLSKAPEAKAGDEVVLLGPGHDAVSADTWGDICGTISYEVLCNVGRLADRVYR